MTAIKTVIIAATLVLMLWLTACGPTLQPAQTILPTPDIALVTPPQDSLDILNWTVQDGDNCKGLVINIYHEMLLNDCQGNTLNIQPEPALFADMANRFASFTYDSGKSRLIFNGKGDITGEAWQPAIARWAEATYAQATTGHVCASCQTILVWNLGITQSTPDMCQQLVVLDYGYAYARIIPCAGTGPSTEVAQAWLETTEWERLNTWFTNHQYTTQTEGYFSSLENGNQAMSQDEIVKLNELAHSIYNRTTQNSNQ